MDSVSRRIGSAALGVAFGLSRDEELEKVKLDLERSRMTAEDYRQGGGPDTSFMHAPVISPADHKVYKLCVEQTKVSARQRQRWTDDELVRTQHDRRNAVESLARIIRTTPLPGTVFNEAQEYFDSLRYDSAEVRVFAQDGRGHMNLHLDGDRPSDNETVANF